jgi:hypothetical protein
MLFLLTLKHLSFLEGKKIKRSISAQKKGHSTNFRHKSQKFFSLSCLFFVAGKLENVWNFRCFIQKICGIKRFSLARLISGLKIYHNNFSCQSITLKSKRWNNIVYFSFYLLVYTELDMLFMGEKRKSNKNLSASLGMVYQARCWENLSN